MIATVAYELIALSSINWAISFCFNFSRYFLRILMYFILYF